MSVEREAIAGLKWSGLSKLASQIITWAITLVVLRILSPSDYGLMAILSVFIALLASVAELGLGASLIQSKELSREEIESVTGLVVVANLAAFLLLLISAPLIAAFYSEPRLTLLVRIAAFQFVFNALATVPQALAYRDMRFGWLAFVDLLVTTLGGVITILIAWHGGGVWALLLGNLAQNLLRALMLTYGNLPRLSFTRRGMRGHVEFGTVVALLRLIMQVINQSDVIIAGRLLGPQAVGLYSVSLHFATLPMQKIMGTINQVAFPAVSKLQLEPERLRRRMLEATRLLLHVVVPLLWGMSATAPDLVHIVMGEKWSGAIRPMQVVCIAVPFQLLNAFYSTAALGMRDLRTNVYNVIVSAAILPGIFFLGARWGVNGLAYAWMTAIPVVFLLRLPGTIKSVNVTPKDMFLVMWAPFLAAALMYGAVTIGRVILVGDPAWIRVIVLVGIGALCYIGVTLVIDRRAVRDAAHFLAALRA